MRLTHKQRPLSGAGLVNLASDIRAPIDSGPIEPMGGGNGLPLLPSIVGAAIIAAFLSWWLFFS